jgi:protein-tyrosine phosphatase/arsenate reductase
VFPAIKKYCEGLIPDFGKIPEERKTGLEKVTSYVKEKISQGQPANLVYICTHNSRRSHFGQIWAKVAADHYQIKTVNTYSGGTEATAFNKNAINALMRAGFRIEAMNFNENPVYLVRYDSNAEPIECFSKVFDDKKNPLKDFAAIMTCSEAETNCPHIPGAELRVSTTYEDPKVFDSTGLQDTKYDERCRQIALETFYIFSKIK